MSNLQFHTVEGDREATFLNGASLRGVLDHYRIGIVDMDIDDALDRQGGQLLQTSIRASYWQMPHRPRSFLTHAQADQFVIRPTRAVDEQAGALLQLVEHPLVELLNSGM
jgi:hypothetical protein